MNRIDTALLTDRFREFTAGFLRRAGDGAYNVQLKIDHTMRVVDIASEVAAREGFEPPVARLCAVAALFHDVGRFPQFERWGVFNDASSENHARLGVRALLRHGLLDGLDAAQRRTVVGAVFLHNRRHLPAHLPEPLDSVARTVRDADKLDIFPVMLAHLDNDRPHNKVVTMGIKPHPDHYTPSMVEHLRKRRIAPYSEMRWYNDFKLLVLSWVYDLNYDTSLHLLHRLGYVEQVLAALPEDDALAAVGGQVRADLAARQ